MSIQPRKMISFHASKAFVERFGCAISLPKDKPAQTQSINAWSGDLLKVPRAGQVAVMMHNASLVTLIVPLKGVRRFVEFLPLFLQGVAELWMAVGATFDPANQQMIILRRTNRSLIGSMNNAKELLDFTVFDQMERGESIDWNEAQALINGTPFSAIDYDLPLEKLATLLLPTN